MTLPHSPACDLLGSTLPIVLAGMGGVARSELVAAVTAAGGFGFLGMVREPAELIEREVTHLRRQGHARFGVNIIPAATDPALLDRQVATCIALDVPVVCTFWTLDRQVVRRLRDAGILVVHQVGTVDEAVEAASAGVQLIIAQGCEAGGHVRARQPLRSLLPAVVDAVDIPVLAAGGMATGSDLVTSMALGGAGMVLGTAFMATEESFAHVYHKQRLLAARAEDTLLTTDFHINWPRDAAVRVLRNAVTNGELGDPDTSTRTVIGDEEGRPIYLFSTDSPLRSMTGDFESMALYAGTGIGRIDSLGSAAARLRQIIADAEALLNPEPGHLPAEIEPSSPVCYAGEMSGDYMGEAGLGDDLAHLAALLRRALRTALSDAAGPPDISEPPFADGAASLATWAILARQAAADAGAFPLPRLPANATGVSDTALLLQVLGGLVPRVSDVALRQRLIALRLFLQGGNAAASLGRAPVL